MTTYRDKYIREIFLAAMARIAKREDSRERYAAIIGRVQALLDDDPDVVAAIEAAFRGSQDKAGGGRG